MTPEMAQRMAALNWPELDPEVCGDGLVNVRLRRRDVEALRIMVAGKVPGREGRKQSMTDAEAFGLVYWRAAARLIDEIAEEEREAA